MKTTSLKAIALMLVLTLSMPGMGVAMMLCIGEDGHLHLKVGSSNEMTADSNVERHDCDGAADSQDPCDSPEDSCCLDCVDIPLPSQPYATSVLAGKRTSSHARLARGFSAHHIICDTFVSSTRSSLDTDRVTSYPDTTVVLRI